MPLQIARNDITKMMVDAIVNAANSTLFSSGVYGYPKNKSLKVAIDVISDFLLENEMTVYIVIYDKKAYQISEKLISDISEYIDDRYFEEHTYYRRESMRINMPMASAMVADLYVNKAIFAETFSR